MECNVMYVYTSLRQVPVVWIKNQLSYSGGHHLVFNCKANIRVPINGEMTRIHIPCGFNHARYDEVVVPSIYSFLGWLDFWCVAEKLNFVVKRVETKCSFVYVRLLVFTSLMCFDRGTTIATAFCFTHRRNQNSECLGESTVVSCNSLDVYIGKPSDNAPSLVEPPQRLSWFALRLLRS